MSDDLTMTSREFRCIINSEDDVDEFYKIVEENQKESSNNQPGDDIKNNK